MENLTMWVSAKKLPLYCMLQKITHHSSRSNHIDLISLSESYLYTLSMNAIIEAAEYYKEIN